MNIERYYDIYEKTNELVNKLVGYTNGEEIINMGYGNYDSHLVLILNDPSQDEILKIYDRALASADMGMYDIYVTYLNKTSIQQLNLNALKKEFEIFGNMPKYIIHDLNVNLNNYDITCISSKMLLRFKELLDIKADKITDEEKKEKDTLSSVVWNSIGPQIYYAKQFV